MTDARRTLTARRLRLWVVWRTREALRSPVVVLPEPRYDDVYFEGVAWLDSL